MIHGIALLALFLAPVQESRLDPAELFAYDRSLPLESTDEVEEQTEGYTRFRITYRSAHGLRVTASLAHPKPETDELIPVLLLVHGLGGSRKDFREYEKVFVGAGYALFAIDAPGHGERRSEGEAPEFFGRHPYATRDLLIQAVIDCRRAIDYLSRTKQFDAKRIGYIGTSMGGKVGALLAGVDDRVQAPVLVVAGGDWKKMLESSKLPSVRKIRDDDPKKVEEYLRALDPVDPCRWVGRISPRPVLMINGDADSIVPPESNKALHAAAKEPKKVVWYKGDHMPSREEEQKLVGVVLEWLAANLKK